VVDTTSGGGVSVPFSRVVPQQMLIDERIRSLGVDVVRGQLCLGMWQTGQRIQGVGAYVVEGPKMELKVSGEVVVEIRALQVVGLSTRGSVSASPSSGGVRRGSKIGTCLASALSHSSYLRLWKVSYTGRT